MNWMTVLRDFFYLGAPTNVYDFEVGQKVYCIYHLVGSFRPPMSGEVIARSIRPFEHHFAKSGKCARYVVRMQNGMVVEYPEVCMYDLAKHIESSKRFIEDSKHRIGDPGFSIESYIELSARLSEASSFYHS